MLGVGKRQQLQLGHEHFASEALGGDVHFFFGRSGNGDGAVFVQREGHRAVVADAEFGGGELHPAGTHAKRDGVRTDFDDGVLWRIESVGGGVAAKQ